MKLTPCWIWTCAVLLVGCGAGQEALGVDETPHVAGINAASAPTAVPVFDQFVDVNPCSGLEHTVTVTGTAWIHEQDGRQVVRFDRTVSTSTGFQGRGTVTFVSNGNIEKTTLNDMLVNEAGQRIRAHFVLVLDLSTTPATAQVLQGAVTCVST